MASSVLFLSQLTAQVAFAQDAPATSGAKVAPAEQTAIAPTSVVAPPPKVIGAGDSGISGAKLEAGPPSEAPVTFYPDRYPPPETRWKTLGLGAGLVAVGYGIAIGTSYLWDGAPGMQSLRTPVIGSIGAIADSGCGEAEGISCTTVTVVLRALLAGVSGLAQIGGIGVLTEGALMKTQERTVTSAQARTWYALPTASKSGGGVSVGMIF